MQQMIIWQIHSYAENAAAAESHNSSGPQYRREGIP